MKLKGSHSLNIRACVSSDDDVSLPDDVVVGGGGSFFLGACVSSEELLVSLLVDDLHCSKSADMSEIKSLIVLSELTIDKGFLPMT